MHLLSPFLVLILTAAWYYASTLLVNGGMVYGRNTLLTMLVLLLFRAIDHKFMIPAKHDGIYILLIVASFDMLYALLVQWHKVAGVVKKLYDIAAAALPLYCIPVTAFMLRFQLLPLGSIRAVLVLLFIANLAAALHNFRGAKRGKVIPIILTVFSMILMTLFMAMELFRAPAHPGCLM